MGSERECGDEVAVVEFGEENLKPGSEAWVSACGVVRRALEEHGCFIAVYDKVSTELCNSVLWALEQLFDLPLETKKQPTSEKLFHSYFGVPWLPLYESLAIDNALTNDGCQHFTRIMWPQGNHRFWYIYVYIFFQL
ncbi:putative 2-oxoglutarate-dependent dioxygenase AOP1 [Senna tora]|uniref:Putative 2-oxoglutarate-dependent dioxygenase AOP1 n=1 Tax=Senna tora TaxID=362788 RepID=A0A834SIE6_9FABA|nr:putative 2-oxoglutarate-dependent dioxygenase AOP1 [Senna tora]